MLVPGSVAMALRRNRTLKVVPRPRWLATSSVPPWLRTIPRTAASPSPQRVVFVLKNRSSIRSNVAGSIPQPVAAIVCRCTVGIIGLRINHGLVKVTLIVALGLPDAFPVALSR